METKNSTTPAQATHPGELLKDEIDATPGLNQRKLAKEIDVQPSLLNEIIKGKRPITADIAILLEKVLGISADYWMRFQSQYEIDTARIKEKNIKKINNIAQWSTIKEYVPVSYFRRKGYLSDDIEGDIREIKTIYGVDDVNSLASSLSDQRVAYYRKSTKSKVDEKNLFAWSSLALFEAKKQKVNSFDYSRVDELCETLNSIFYENVDTQERVKTALNQYGIKMLLIDKLEKTPIDGFSFWSDNNPAIAMTLRYNRIDNFAFTVMHEIGHIDLHLRQEKDKQFMDLSSMQHTDKYETQANNYAQEKLIPKDLWQEILNNHPSLNDDTIRAIGDQYKIHPAIVLGRVCFETDSYARKTTIDKKMK